MGTTLRGTKDGVPAARPPSPAPRAANHPKATGGLGAAGEEGGRFLGAARRPLPARPPARVSRHRPGRDPLGPPELHAPRGDFFFI